MHHEELRAQIALKTFEEGGTAAAANKWGVSEGYLERVIRGQVAPGPRVCQALEVVPYTSYGRYCDGARNGPQQPPIRIETLDDSAAEGPDDSAAEALRIHNDSAHERARLYDAIAATIGKGIGLTMQQTGDTFTVRKVAGRIEVIEGKTLAEVISQL